MLLQCCEVTWPTGHCQEIYWIKRLVSYVQVQFDFNRNKYFDTKEALEYGIIDQVVRPLRTQALGI